MDRANGRRSNGWGADLGTAVPIGLMAAGAAALVRRPTLLGAALLGFLAYEVWKESDDKRDGSEATSEDDSVDQAIADSFPASDPPGFSGSIPGSS